MTDKLGLKVVMLDESGNWKGAGTAIQMARTNADVYASQQLRALGVTMMAETVMLEWRGDSAAVRPIGGAVEVVTADSLVIAETPMAASVSKNIARFIPH